MPSGHEPGVQSLRNESGLTGFTVWEWFTGVVGAGMVGGGVFLAVGGRGGSFDPREEALGGSVFAFFGLVCVFQAYRWHRGNHPLKLAKRLPGITLAVDTETVKRGSSLSIMLTFSSKAAGKEEQLEVGVVCTELYDYQVRAQTRAGPIDVRQTGRANAHERWERVNLREGGRTFSFEVPTDAPYSYEGECISYAWRASVRDVRQLRSDPRLDLPFWVLP